MLVLTCPVGGTLWIGRDIKITLRRRQGDEVTVGLVAPADASVALGHIPLQALGNYGKTTSYLFSLPHANRLQVGSVEVGIELAPLDEARDGVEGELIHIGVTCPGPIRIGFESHRDERVPVVRWHPPATACIRH